MASDTYDPETEQRGTSSTGSGTRPTSSPFTSSTSSTPSSYSQTDALDPVRKAERGGGFYNPSDNQAGGNPKAGGSSSKTSSGSGGSNNSTAADGGGSSTPSRDDIKNSEESSNEDSDRVGKGYTPGNSSSTGSGQTKVRITRKRALIGGGAIAGVVGTGVIGFFLLIPLKIETIVTDLESRFFGVAENAVGNETDNMVEGFFKNEIGPAMKAHRCSTEGKIVVSKDCSLNFTGNGNNPVQNLYKTWSQAKLENTLADQYGIEVRYDESVHGGTYYLKAPGVSGEAEVGDVAHGIDSDFDAVDRGQVRVAFKSAEKDMTSWDKIMFRYKVGTLLEDKYGIKRCIVFCGTRDALTDKASSQKYAAKLFLVDRVITPRNAALGSVIGCLINQKCTQPETTTTCAEANCDEMDNVPEIAADAGVEEAIGEASTGFGSETATKLIGAISDVRDAGGFQNYAFNKVLDSIGLDSLAEGAAVGVGVIGTASTVLGIMRNAGPETTKLSYITNSHAAVNDFMMYRTYADEIHTGHINATELGSFNDSLGPGSQCDPALEGKCGTQVGGTASAEETPLYANLIDNGSGSGSTTTSLLNDILPAKAYAAAASDTSTGSSSYKCGANNDSTVAAGQLVCPEENLGAGNTTLNNISSFLNGGVVGALTSVITSLGGLINDLTGALGIVIDPILSSLGGLTSIITNTITPFFKSLASDIVPNPFGEDGAMSGGRNFDMLAAGADVSGSDYAHTGLGGARVPATQAAEISSEQENEAEQQFSQESFFARMFSTDTQYSLVSRVAMDIPFGLHDSAVNSFASLISNPFGELIHSFSSVFSGRVSAATLSGVVGGQDVFGVTQYEPEVVADPSSYWDAHCSDNPAQAYQNDADFNNPATNWNGQAAAYEANNPNDPNGAVNTTANPCVLIEASVGSAGGVFDSSLLTPAEQASVSGSSAGTSTGTTSPGGGSTGIPTGTAQDLATQLLPYISNGKISCNNQASNCPDIQNTATGVSIKGGEGCEVDSLSPTLLGMLLKLVQMGHTFVLSAICSDHTDDGGTTAGHSAGKAVDFNYIDGVFMGPDDVPWDQTKINADEKLDQDIASFMPKTTGFGQVGVNSNGVQCHQDYSFLSGFDTFGDTCNHQHVQVD